MILNVYSPFSVTVGSVDIKIVAQDDKSGVKSIEKPDGTIENASMVTYTVTPSSGVISCLTVGAVISASFSDFTVPNSVMRNG